MFETCPLRFNDTFPLCHSGLWTSWWTKAANGECLPSSIGQSIAMHISGTRPRPFRWSVIRIAVRIPLHVTPQQILEEIRKSIRLNLTGVTLKNCTEVCILYQFMAETSFEHCCRHARQHQLCSPGSDDYAVMEEIKGVQQEEEVSPSVSWGQLILEL